LTPVLQAKDLLELFDQFFFAFPALNCLEALILRQTYGLAKPISEPIFMGDSQSEKPTVPGSKNPITRITGFPLGRIIGRADLRRHPGKKAVRHGRVYILTQACVLPG
jgi:hypothetical protein